MRSLLVVLLVAVLVTAVSATGWRTRTGARPSDDADSLPRSCLECRPDAGRVWLQRNGQRRRLLLYDTGLGDDLNRGMAMNTCHLRPPVGRRIGDHDLWRQRVDGNRGSGRLYLFRVGESTVDWQVVSVGWGEYRMAPTGAPLSCGTCPRSGRSVGCGRSTSTVAGVRFTTGAT